jgi:hypothetical protein
MLQGQLPIGRLDLVLSRILFDTENLVEVGCNWRARRSVVFVGGGPFVVILFEHILGIRRHDCGVYGCRCRERRWKERLASMAQIVLESPKDPQKSDEKTVER